MTDQVLIIDPENFKALTRRSNAFLELGETSKAKESLDKGKKLAISDDDKKIIKELFNTYEKKHKEEKNFAKKIFETTKTSTIYKDKSVVSQNKIDPLVDQDEVEYLKTIGNLHWFLYPYIKTFKAVLNCRRKPIPFREEFAEGKEKEE
mmetsp:Transcript_8093/g.7163  ORF Transcript_8093/g.7163 Transcript_8093/m.7163 type:complete len:149 (+) Transcript_8093:413-859(+)